MDEWKEIDALSKKLDLRFIFKPGDVPTLHHVNAIAAAHAVGA